MTVKKTPIDFSSNVWKLYGIGFFWSFLLVAPLMVPILKQNGLSMTEVFLIQSIFSVTLLFSDIPSGYFSDVFGRKITLIIASLFKGIGGVLFACSTTFYGFALSYLFIGFANGLYNGSEVSLLVETCENSPSSDRSKIFHALGRLSFFSHVATFLASITAAWLTFVSLDFILVVNAIIAFFPFLLSLLLKEAPREYLQKPQTTHYENFSSSFRKVFFQKGKLRQVVVLSIFIGCTPILGTLIFQGYWGALSIPISWFGYIGAAYGLIAAFSSNALSFFSSRFSRNTILLIIALLPFVGFSGSILQVSALVIFSGAFLEISRGFSNSWLSAELNQQVSSNTRATMNSFSSSGVRILVSIFGPLLGWCADHLGYSIVFAAAAAVYFILFLFLRKANA